MEQLMTFAEAARLARNSHGWWRKLAQRRGIAVVKLGRCARLRQVDVERVIADGLRPACDEAARLVNAGR